jgi:hypothetical protein
MHCRGGLLRLVGRDSVEPGDGWSVCWLRRASPYQNASQDWGTNPLFFFLDDLVDFAGAVEKQSRLERKHQ